MSLLRRVLLLAALLAAPAARADARRFALVAGEPDGGGGTVRLRYAERDARRIHEILTRVGGVDPADARLLLSAGAGAFRRGLEELSRASADARARGERTQLVVYFSGHAKDEALRFGGGRLPLAELRAALEQAPADVRIALVDSCRSGALARSKGVRAAPAFEVRTGDDAAPAGLVIIASSSADEDSQESDAIGASWFTHHLASGAARGGGRLGRRPDHARRGVRVRLRPHGRLHRVERGRRAAPGLSLPARRRRGRGPRGASAGAGRDRPARAVGRLYVVLDRSGRAVAEVAKLGGDRAPDRARGRAVHGEEAAARRLGPPRRPGRRRRRARRGGRRAHGSRRRSTAIRRRGTPGAGWRSPPGSEPSASSSRRPRRALPARDARRVRAGGAGRSSATASRGGSTPRWAAGAEWSGSPGVDPIPVRFTRGRRAASRSGSDFHAGPVDALRRRAGRVHLARPHLPAGAGAPGSSTSSR